MGFPLFQVGKPIPARIDILVLATAITFVEVGATLDAQPRTILAANPGLRNREYRRLTQGLGQIDHSLPLMQDRGAAVTFFTVGIAKHQELHGDRIGEGEIPQATTTLSHSLGDQFTTQHATTLQVINQEISSNLHL